MTIGKFQRSEITLFLSTKFLFGLEETLCRLKKVSVEVYVLGNYANNRSRTSTDAYSNASFSSVTAATESLKLSDNGFKTA